MRGLEGIHKQPGTYGCTCCHDVQGPEVVHIIDDMIVNDGRHGPVKPLELWANQPHANGIGNTR